MVDGDEGPSPEHERPGVTDPSPDCARSDEPFPCPHCGQMLAPTCRVCVACKEPVDVTQLKRSAAPPVETTAVQPPVPPPEPARFSWSIFFFVLIAWLGAAVVTQQLLGAVKSQWVLGSVVLLSSVWVFYDAEQKRVPKPLRWGLGSLLLWILVFPWYLARRTKPQAPCPFIEREAGPVTRALLFALVLFFLLSIVVMIFVGPSPK
jgi:energy-converting hydrogenase Eha subunit A